MEQKKPTATYTDIELVIFDCDGVLIDSEILCKSVLISMLQDLGVKIDGDYFDRHFLGKSYDSAKAQIAEDFDISLPVAFRDDYLTALLAVFAEELAPTNGLEDLLHRLVLPKCIATSSHPERVAFSLKTTALDSIFNSDITTSAEVTRGKPAPDIFLLAAKKMGVLPEKCLVIEDSDAGIIGALSAGMKVVKYTGASHFEGKQSNSFGEVPVINSWCALPELYPTLFDDYNRGR
ncbi:HAD family phosphatase [Alteromonas sp. ALT199]|uniref:HAD family hydrolase n=1 Tax=unclassified Alteromonas TaxID=2614992 RepID=UPI001BE9D44C|nr:HAD family phosphatase [Alteromonas sp. ALT199]MBT3135041.1 HAD family phosphatase [Alteromonas sp. ALT199]